MWFNVLNVSVQDDKIICNITSLYAQCCSLDAQVLFSRRVGAVLLTRMCCLVIFTPTVHKRLVFFSVNQSLKKVQLFIHNYLAVIRSCLLQIGFSRDASKKHTQQNKQSKKTETYKMVIIANVRVFKEHYSRFVLSAYCYYVVFKS